MDVLVDGTKFGWNETFMRVQTQTACNDVLATFPEEHGDAYHPLTNGTKVSLLYAKLATPFNGSPQPTSALFMIAQFS